VADAVAAEVGVQAVPGRTGHGADGGADVTEVSARLAGGYPLVQRLLGRPQQCQVGTGGAHGLDLAGCLEFDHQVSCRRRPRGAAR
jgi:hypothetical protein